MSNILVIDDEINIRNILKLLLQKNEHVVTLAASGEEATQLNELDSIDAAIVDINLPGMNGIETMQILKTKYPAIQFVFITAHGTFSLAVEAIKKGGYNFVSKPFDNEELLGILNGALQVKLLSDKLLALESQLRMDDPFAPIIGSSAALKQVLQLGEKVAQTDASILVTGESGTGKELLVRSLHKLSSRKDKAFVVINCAAIPPNLFESEFFGYVKGAFTGAISDHTGKFKVADKGTLFLDEITELPLEFQAKLLRVLEYGEYNPVGSNQTVLVNVRIIAATNKSIPDLIEEKLFREDLYYRLAVFNLSIPSLRERKEDIALLATYFLKKYSEATISEDAMKILINYPWYGNIRELRNEMQRVAILANQIVLPENLSIRNKEMLTDNLTINSGFSLEKEIKETEMRYYKKAMLSTNNNKALAAKLLGVSYRTFNYQWAKFQDDFN